MYMKGRNLNKERGKIATTEKKCWIRHELSSNIIIKKGAYNIYDQLSL